MPTARTVVAGRAFNNKLYVVGGRNAAGSDVATLEVYDPTTDTWVTEAPMPTARRGLVAAVVNDILYAVGGGGGGTSVIATNEAYTP